MIKNILSTNLGPVAILYACCTWTITARDKNKLSTFKRKVLRKMYRQSITLTSMFGKLKQLYGKEKNISISKKYKNRVS